MEKITTEESYLKWADTLNHIRPETWFSKQPLRYIKLGRPWWADREALRFRNNIYKTTTTLDFINDTMPVFAHVSTEDSKMVAFTPDAQAGLQDRQVRTTIGKLLTKFFPVIQPEYLKVLVDAHEYEINPEVLWAYGSEITSLYANGMGGIGACMSKDGTWSSLIKNRHPTEVYDMPGIAMAYLMQHGNMVARCMTYTNGNDKRMIRAYPNQGPLSIALENLGYKVGNWGGVEFKRIDIGGNLIGKNVVMPYLDANYGRATSEECSVALLDGKLMCLTMSQYKVLKSKNIQTSNASTTNGVICVQDINTDVFSLTCALTGVTFDTTIHTDIETASIWKDNKKQVALKIAVPTYFVLAQVLPTLQNVAAHPDDVIDVYSNTQIRKYVVSKDYIESSLTLLDENTYGEKKYAYRHDSIKIDNKYYLLVHCTKVYDNSTNELPDVIYILNLVFKAIEYKKLHCGTYCTKSSKTLKSTSGKHLMKGVSKYYTTITGEYTIRKPLYSKMFDRVLYYSNSNIELEEFTQKKRENHFTLCLEVALKVMATSNSFTRVRALVELCAYADTDTYYCKDCFYKDDIAIKPTIAWEKFANTYFALQPIFKNIILNRLAEMTAIEYL